MKTLAIIIADPSHGRLGHAGTLHETLAGRTVLQHTVDRVATIQGVDELIVLHPQGRSLAGLYTKPAGVDLVELPAESREKDHWQNTVINAGRKWALTAWRGGIGGMSVYDELLPAYPLLRALDQREADAAVIVRGDWCCVDPALATKQLELFKTAPEALKLTFTQAPPGLGALVISKSVLSDLVEHQATIANILCYNPKKPVIDPVGKDVNVPIPASVRDQFRRFIFDTPRATAHLREIAELLGAAFASADAAQITDASRAIETDRPEQQLQRLPQQLTIELSPRREATGPIVPQQHIDLSRADMTRDTLDTALAELGESGDTAVLLGGLGDALLSDQIEYAVTRAHELGVMGIGIETDLLCDPAMIPRIAALPLDVVAVRINADSAQVYQDLMGIEDGYRRVLDNIQELYKLRQNNRTMPPDVANFRGWIVPRMTKVAENLKDLETFFERWMTITGWAVVDRAWTGMGLIADQSPVPMDPPRKPAKANIQKTRLTILADGTVTLCGQDWLGRASLGQIQDTPLTDLWRSAPRLADQIQSRPEGDRPICVRCQDWLASQQRVAAGV